jgi:hypothetical protein
MLKAVAELSVESRHFFQFWGCGPKSLAVKAPSPAALRRLLVSPDGVIEGDLDCLRGGI